MFAIVIPYYKIDFFEETLKSVVAQTDKRSKLYIGNDASPDDPLPLIEKYFPDGGFHYFKYEDNLGGKNLAAQWERILENVTEEWFQILGDDDVLSENFVESFYTNISEIDNEGCNVVKFSQCWIDETGGILNNFTNYPKFISPAKNLNFKLTHGHRSSLSEYIFRTTSYRKFGFINLPLAWGTDDLAVFEFSEGKPIGFIASAQVLVFLQRNRFCSMVLRWRTFYLFCSSTMI